MYKLTKKMILRLYVCVYAIKNKKKLLINFFSLYIYKRNVNATFQGDNKKKKEGKKKSQHQSVRHSGVRDKYLYF